MDADLLALRIKVTGGKVGAGEVRALNTEVAKTAATTKAAGDASAASAAKIAKTATSLKSVGRSMTTYLSLPLAGIGVASGLLALDFDRAMRNVNSIAQLPAKRFDSLKQQVLDMAGPTAQAPKTLAEGLYALVSSGFDAAESIVILRKSALAASAGLTTTEVSTKAVAASLNAYHLPAKKAAWVSDTLFETVNRGVLTFDELASTIGDTLPFAAQMHVGLNEVGAALATMTKQGLSSAEAVTRTKNVLVTLIKPGKDLSKALDTIGMSGEELVKKKGLQGALEAIVGTTKGGKDEIAALFPNIRALGGVLSLVGKNAKFANEDLAAFKDTTGATSKVLREQEKSFGFQLQRGWADLLAVLIELGERLLPIVVPFLLELAKAGKNVVGWFAKLPPPLQKVGLALAGLAILAGPMLMMAGSVLQLGLALQTIGAFSALGAAGPAAGFLAILGLEVAGFLVLYNKVKWFRDAVDVIWRFVGNQMIFLLSPIALLIAHFGLLKDAAASVASFFSGAFGAAIHWVGNAVSNVAAFFGALPGKIGDALAKVPGIIWAALQKTPMLLGRFIGFWLGLPFRIGYIMVRLGIKVLGGIERLKARLPGLAASAFMALLHGFARAAPAIFHFIVSASSRILGILASLPSKMLSLGARAIGLLLRGLIRGATALWAWELSLPGKFLGFIGRIAPKMFEVGKSIASQIAHGLAQGLADMLPGPVKDALGKVGGVAGDVGGFIGGAFATGTLSAPGGMALVGERGPELVNLPRTSQVIPAASTHRILTAFDRSPRPAALAEHVRRVGGGETRYLVAQPVKIGRKVVAEAVTEAREDAEARL